MHFMSLIIYRKSKTIFKSFLNSYVYWDTLYDNSRFPVGQNALYSAASVAQKFDFAQEIRKSEIWSGEVIFNIKILSERFAPIFYLCEQFVFLVKQKQKSSWILSKNVDFQSLMLICDILNIHEPSLDSFEVRDKMFGSAASR